MPLPPPKKKLVPPQSKKDDSMQFQPNRDFDSEKELHSWLNTTYKGRAIIVKSWETKVFRCIIKVKPEEKK